MLKLVQQLRITNGYEGMIKCKKQVAPQTKSACQVYD